MPVVKAAKSPSQMRHRTDCKACKNAENMEIVERPREASHVTKTPVNQRFFESPTRF